MAQHFLLSNAAIPIVADDIYRLDEEEARLMLARLRWGSPDQQVCPTCGVIDSHYVIRTRKQWRCKHCSRTFSVTSDTPFADRKISHRHILIALFEFLSSRKGLAALKLRTCIGHSYRTCFTQIAKVREALCRTDDPTLLDGLTQMDGGHFSGRPRKGRRKKKPDEPTVPNRFSKEHRSKVAKKAYATHPNRRIIVVARQVSPEGGVGGVRTRVAICRSENPDDLTALAKLWVRPDSMIWTDEGNAFKRLKLVGFKHKSVNHQVEFSTDDGVSDNIAESYFSRMRRGVIGIYHRVTPHYMLDYAVETAWREDTRRKSTLEQMIILGSRVFNAGRSVDWLNYSHGHHRPQEHLFSHNGVKVQSKPSGRKRCQAPAVQATQSC